MRYRLSGILRGGNAEKWNFDWVIAPPKYDCVVVEWVLGINKNISNLILDTRWRCVSCFEQLYKQINGNKF